MNVSIRGPGAPIPCDTRPPLPMGFAESALPTSTGRSQAKVGTHPRGWKADVMYVPSAENAHTDLGSKLRRYCDAPASAMPPVTYVHADKLTLATRASCVPPHRMSGFPCDAKEEADFVRSGSCVYPYLDARQRRGQCLSPQRLPQLISGRSAHGAPAARIERCRRNLLSDVQTASYLTCGYAIRGHDRRWLLRAEVSTGS